MAKKVKTRLGPSTIHGQGLFADQKIAAGTWIIQYTGQKLGLKEGRRRDRFYNSIGYTLLFKLDSHYVDGLIGGNESIYINHSLTPNAEAFMHRGGVWIQALRDIADGEEITYDYGFDPANPGRA
ncbi:SET domain-containing protein-lysine N-methyltransferase [Roseiarcaceae bacterium H3SJ34-1]|uniref:SET domain-containing protein n=1 Tax=Terripilifer ovatus TaxID=3032367 RepID=UPI003AB95138|nr:SET domain-containing protein-lysine N-methyltransferase [Roseiarcaceae bacterium H3SJ34-1]